jgi:hypothetical protein
MKKYLDLVKSFMFLLVVLIARIGYEGRILLRWEKK